MKKKWLGGILFGVLAIGILRQLWDEVGSSRRTLKVPSSSRSEKPVARGNSIEILTQQEEELPIGNHSTITSDIVKVWHDIDSKAICVELKRDARCPHPAFLGRLSGPALAILEWNERQFDDNNGTILCGGYGHYWLDAGDYFVDILIIHCADFGVNALKRNGNKTAWLEVDHKFDCVEDPDHSQITTNEEGQQPVIHIPASIEGRDSYRFGRWIRKPDIPSKPLFHRYQPRACLQPGSYREGSPIRAYCTSRMERDSDGSNGTKITGVYEYEFQWNMKVSQEELVERLRRQRQNEEGKTTPKICAVGDSHSRLMAWKTLRKLDLRGLFTYVKSPWISPDGIVKRIEGRNCDIFFIQVGQWPASHNANGHPFSFGMYHDKLKEHVQNILNFNPSATVYLLTIDQGPLMARVNSCKDWRTPTYLDGYSYVNQMIVKELNTERVRYVDTNFIIYTHFDSHRDWQHLLEVVRSRKAIYMAATMLGELEWAGLSDITN